MINTACWVLGVHAVVLDQWLLELLACNCVEALIVGHVAVLKEWLLELLACCCVEAKAIRLLELLACGCVEALIVGRVAVSKEWLLELLDCWCVGSVATCSVGVLIDSCDDAVDVLYIEYWFVRWVSMWQSFGVLRALVVLNYLVLLWCRLPELLIYFLEVTLTVLEYIYGLFLRQRMKTTRMTATMISMVAVVTEAM